jgi:hypothetical protein
MSKKIIMVSEVRAEKNHANAIADAKSRAIEMEKFPSRFLNVSNLDPRIGILMRNGREVFYVTIAGNTKTGTLAEVQELLTSTKNN